MQKPLQYSLPQPKGEVANGADGQHPVAANSYYAGFGCRIKFYAENTTCRLFRRELWCAKAPLLETFMRRLFLHNNLTREKSEFQPANADLVTVYVCGPTVYGPAHIGNARPAVVFDVLVRLLRELYPAVSYARNITDIDDKINAQQQKRRRYQGYYRPISRKIS